MDLKNAAAVCLISLFSATLVVLIARSLDSQAASQLEPQLTAIAEELQAIRKQGGMAASPDDAAAVETLGDGLVVYYFHSNARCITCRAVEAQTKATLDADFAPQLNRGDVAWKILNFQKPSGAKLADKFEVKDPVVVLARMKGGEIADWKRLDKVMALTGDKDAFSKYVRGAIQEMLVPDKPAAPAAGRAKEPPAIPIPE